MGVFFIFFCESRDRFEGFSYVCLDVLVFENKYDQRLIGWFQFLGVIKGFMLRLEFSREVRENDIFWVFQILVDK